MPLREMQRLQAVNRFLKLETKKEKELQAIVELAAKICGTPTALITMVDEDTQYIKFKVGTDLESTSRQQAFCNEVIKQYNVLVVPDALLDERFQHNPYVTGDCGVRFYAGAPLTTQDGFNLGGLCVIDHVPQQLTEIQKEMLIALSRQVIQLLEFDSSVSILKEQFIKAKQSEIELRSFFESSIDCHLLLGKDFEVLAFNKALERLVNKAFKQPLERGSQMGSYISPEFKNDFYLNYRKALQGTASFEERKITYEEETVWWVIKYEPAFNPDGDIIGVSVNSSDVTARVMHEQKVHKQHQSLEEIAFIQSHELRRPVATIMGLLNLLKMDQRSQEIEEYQLLEKAANELDEKYALLLTIVIRSKAYKFDLLVMLLRHEIHVILSDRSDT